MKTRNQKGITLIALIITIIVMLILVGVSVSVALNTGLFKTAQGAAKNTEAERINETALSNGTINIKGQEEEIDIDDYVASLKGEEEEGAQWELTTDADENGEISVGDLLSPTVEGLENEKFYVIADNGTTLTLLAERNVDTSASVNAQASGINPVAFDDGLGDNVYANSSIGGLVNAYVGTLTGLNLENVEVEYGGNPVTGVKGRLMWEEEAENPIFKAATNYSDILYGPSTARINYWLGSPIEGTTSDACFVVGDYNVIAGGSAAQRRLWASSSYKNLKI